MKIFKKVIICLLFFIISFTLYGFSEVEKYYIYINNERYAEIPKEYDIKHDVHIISNPDIDKRLQFKSGTSPDGNTIYVKQYITNDLKSELFKTILRHELRHVKQLEEEGFWDKFKEQNAQVGIMKNPYEIDARNWGRNRTDIIFQLIDRFAIELQGQQEQQGQQQEKFNQAIKNLNMKNLQTRI